MTTFNITLPNWFLAIFSLAFIVFIFYLGGLHTKIKEICQGYPKIQEALIRISEVLLQRKLTTDPVFVCSESPIKLTEEGMEALKEAKFEEFYNANKNILLERIKKSEPKTMADLEQVCKSVMLQVEDTLPNFESIKQFAYNKGVPIVKILFAAAVRLKDIAAEELKINPT